MRAEGRCPTADHPLELACRQCLQPLDCSRPPACRRLQTDEASVKTNIAISAAPVSQRVVACHSLIARVALNNSSGELNGAQPQAAGRLRARY